MGLIFSAFSWTYAALQIPGGWVLDRVGPRITFGVAMIFWSIVTGSISLAKGFGSLLGLRLALGVAETPAFPANNALVSRWFPTKERGLATGAYTAGEYVGLAIAAPLAGLDGGYVRVAFGVLPDRRARIGVRVRLASVYPQQSPE